MQRKSNDVYFVFGNDGIEAKIYASVQKKKDYTLSLFVRDYGIKEKNINKSKRHNV